MRQAKPKKPPKKRTRELRAKPVQVRGEKPEDLAPQETFLDECPECGHQTRRPVRFIDKKQLLARIPVTFATIWEKIRKHEFPPPREFGARSFWFEHEVEDHMLKCPVKKYLPK